MVDRTVDVQSWWLEFGGRAVLWWFAAHLVGQLMTLNLWRMLDFYPVWFLDCIACSSSSTSLPYHWPAVGGVSVPGLVAGAASLALLVALRSRAGWSTRVSAGLAAAAAVVHVAIATAARFPGTLPPVLAAIGLPFVAAVLLIVGLFASPAQTFSVPRLALTRIQWLAAAVGAAAMVTLGGVFSLAAVGLGLDQIRRSDRGLGRRVAIGCLTAGVLSLALRVVLVRRFPTLVTFTRL